MTELLDRACERMADEHRRAEIGAVVLWLSNASPGIVSDAARIDVGARVMLASVFAQAGLMGVVLCTRCGDRGCDWCRN